MKKRIMRRVYAVYALKRVLSRTAFKIYVAVALLFGIKTFIHVAAVAENMPDFSNLSGLYNFSLQAVVNTEITVQFIVFGVVALVVWTMRDAVKNILAHKIQSRMSTQ
ncbi:MAG: hypothetical protein ACE5F2_02345 [Candidatus Paceibacteria bacterium]